LGSVPRNWHRRHGSVEEGRKAKKTFWESRHGKGRESEKKVCHLRMEEKRSSGSRAAGMSLSAKDVGRRQRPPSIKGRGKRGRGPGKCRGSLYVHEKRASSNQTSPNPSGKHVHVKKPAGAKKREARKHQGEEKGRGFEGKRNGGRRESGGCLNLSIIDALNREQHKQRLREYTKVRGEREERRPQIGTQKREMALQRFCNFRISSR